MKIIQKALKLKGDEYYKKHLSIINSMLPSQFTSKEIEVLAAFMSADPKLTEDDRFNSLVRKQVMKKLDLKPGGLSNYLKSMINKGFLDKSEITHKITIKEYLLPEDKVQGYQFKLIKE